MCIPVILKVSKGHVLEVGAGEGAWGLTGGGGGIGHALAEKMVSRAGRAAAKIRQPGCSLGCGLQQPGEGTQLPGRVCWRMQLATAT